MFVGYILYLPGQNQPTWAVYPGSVANAQKKRTRALLFRLKLPVHIPRSFNANANPTPFPSRVFRKHGRSPSLTKTPASDAVLRYITYETKSKQKPETRNQKIKTGYQKTMQDLFPEQSHESKTRKQVVLVLKGGIQKYWSRVKIAGVDFELVVKSWLMKVMIREAVECDVEAEAFATLGRHASVALRFRESWMEMTIVSTYPL